MKTDIFIKSDLFPAYKDEEKDINPGRFGKKLGEFIKNALIKNNIEVADFYPTDSCYEIRINKFNFDIFVLTGNLDGEENHFLISIEPKKEFVRKLFKKIPTKPAIEKIYNIIVDELLKEKIEIIKK